MCGRFTLFTSPEEISNLFEVIPPPPFLKARYNIAPSQEVLAVVDDDGEKIFASLHWGLIPFWAKDSSIGNRMINARAETLTEKKSFKVSFKNKRCIIVADGFYELRKQGKEKIPNYIFLKAKKVFGFAGLWSTWKDPKGKVIDSCTIITTEANDHIQPIHNRMPAILKKEDHAFWLQRDLQDTASLLRLLQPYDSESMESYPISNWVNNPNHDGNTCIEKAASL